jgi:hypothetical protein
MRGYLLRGNREIREKSDIEKLEWGSPDDKNPLVHWGAFPSVQA